MPSPMEPAAERFDEIEARFPRISYVQGLLICRILEFQQMCISEKVCFLAVISNVLSMNVANHKCSTVKQGGKNNSVLL